MSTKVSLLTHTGDSYRVHVYYRLETPDMITFDVTLAEVKFTFSVSKILVATFMDELHQRMHDVVV